MPVSFRTGRRAQTHPSQVKLKTMAQHESQAVTLFESVFGTWPNAIAVAPGRINLIGEHVDYSLFPVVPFALAHQRIILVFRTFHDTATPPTLFLHNSNAKKYPSTQIKFQDAVDHAVNMRDWSGYVACAIKGFYTHFNHWKPYYSVECLVYSTLPAVLLFLSVCLFAYGRCVGCWIVFVKRISRCLIPHA